MIYRGLRALLFRLDAERARAEHARAARAARAAGVAVQRARSFAASYKGVILA